MKKQQQGKRVAVIEGWFTLDSRDAHLIGNRCKACGDYFFPKAMGCRNPDCMQEDLEQVFLSKRGKLWSYTNNYYPPPPPYVSQNPFVPYATVVVELAREKLMVLGPLADGYDFEALEAGMEMELVVEPLYIDESGNEHLIWKFKPALFGSKVKGGKR